MAPRARACPCPVAHPRADPATVVVEAYEAHGAELTRYAGRATHDVAVAEDLVQDAFVRLAREVNHGRVPCQPRAWLFRVVTNLVVSRARRQATAAAWARAQVEREDSVGFESPEIDVLGRERRQALRAILERLPRDARTAVVLSSQGFAGEEIAAALGRSHGATRSLLSRTRGRLRAEVAASETLA